MTSPRPLLTDHQCQLFLKDMQDFGYVDLTFTQVRYLADRYYVGHDIAAGNAVGGFLQHQIQEAEEELARRRNGRLQR